MTRRLCRVALATCFAALAGCAAHTPVAVPAVTLFSDSDNQTVDPAVKQMIVDAGDAVAARLQVDLSHVETLVVDKHDMAHWHQASVERSYLNRFDSKHRDRMVRNIVSERLDGILAFYDETEKVIVFDEANVSDYVQQLQTHGISVGEALMPLFLHEWVHAADDMLVDFRTLDQSYGGNSLAYSAVFEGHAELVARELCADFGCARSFEIASSGFRHGGGGVANLNLLPGRSGDSTTLRYLEGRKYLERLVALPNGEALLQAALRQPPRDAVSIFAPDARLDPERERENLNLQQALTRFDLPILSGDWVQLAGDPTDANDFPADPTRRERIVSARLRDVLGAAETVFYEQSGEHLRPLEVRLTRAVSEVAAQQLASSMAARFRRQSGSLIGAGLSLHNLNADQEPLYVDADGVTGRAFNVSANLFAQGEYAGPLSFSASASGNYVIEVVSGLPLDQHIASVRAGRRLLADMPS